MYIHCPIGKTVKLLFLCLQVRDDGVIFILTGNIPECQKIVLGGGGWSYLSGVLNVNSFPGYHVNYGGGLMKLIIWEHDNVNNRGAAMIIDCESR